MYQEALEAQKNHDEGSMLNVLKWRGTFSHFTGVYVQQLDELQRAVNEEMKTLWQALPPPAASVTLPTAHPPQFTNVPRYNSCPAASVTQPTADPPQFTNLPRHNSCPTAHPPQFTNLPWHNSCEGERHDRIVPHERNLSEFNPTDQTQPNPAQPSPTQANPGQ